MKLKKLFFSGKSGIRLALFICAGVLSLAATSHAQPTSPCDPEYMDALEARAWLEAQREIAQNKNFIFKPDSVLEYTCFAGFLDEAASNFNPSRQFSETDRWLGHPDGFSYETTDIALTQVVLQPVIDYLTNNFNSDGDMGAYLNNRRLIEYLPPPAITGADYTCNQMQQVWLAARCMNFNEAPENAFDGFFDFAYYQANDPRRESNIWAMMCNVPDPRIPLARTSAFNEDEALFDVGIEIIEAEGNAAPYLEDDVVTHLDFILPGTCDGPAIATGIRVERPDINGGAPYDERVCPNPGCTNPPGTGDCVP